MSMLSGRLANLLAESIFLRGGRSRWETNLFDWNDPLSKREKVITGLYIILRDHADGLFPPRFADQQKAYEAEIRYDEILPGVSTNEVRTYGMRKPFGSESEMERLLGHLVRLSRILRSLGLEPGAHLLELGCGKGWMAEFLVLMGYKVTGTTLSPVDVDHARTRITSLQAKNLPADLRFRAAPMESVAETVRDLIPFDGVFVFEALHHAYDWRKALSAAAETLRPGGWLVLANEPNLLHTFVSYRVARLSGTHEIGMSRAQIRAYLLTVGFSKVRMLNRRPSLGVVAHWIAAQKSGAGRVSP